jgi:putative transposase
VLVTGIDVRFKEIIQDVRTESKAEQLQLEVMSEHVHLLVEVDPQYGIHRLVRAIKGRSSRLLRQEYPWLRSRLLTRYMPGLERPTNAVARRFLESPVFRQREVQV